MKKYFLLLLFLVLAFLAGWIYVDFSKNKETKDVVNSKIMTKLKNNQLEKPKPPAKKTFSDPAMNMAFNYPGNLILTRVNPQLLSISDTSATDSGKILLIYSTVSDNPAKLTLPFPLPGTLKTAMKITIKDFDARQVTYSDGTLETNLLLLRKKQQTIVIRIPQNSSDVDQAITDLVNSIKTLK